ncbi:hypothetical protein BDP27DRAFT_1417109 [Rhodocollybia butyracea]|uniref:Protein kinase domain-containing protein n=1 Tax=Rhodocollybia butyracea TaxID=206335 RepID=A0A9P5Q3S2_9AGAR|nr:hypothetical protein BDP27DRAFT_1417109 [Rhodocollybia butyracea]
MGENEATTNPVEDTIVENGGTYDIASLKPVDMEFTLKHGGKYDFYSVDGVRMVDYSLPRPDFSTILITEILNDGNFATVYGGHLHDEYNNKVHEVVIKLGELEQMEREAENYDRLRYIQGRVVPRMFGYWDADRKEGKSWGCLVIERFGARLETPFWYLEIEERDIPRLRFRYRMLTSWCRAIILNHLRDIHNEALVHNDFEPRNILQKGKEFRIIDLESLAVHTCTKRILDFTTFLKKKDTLALLSEFCSPLVCRNGGDGVRWLR